MYSKPLAVVEGDMKNGNMEQSVSVGPGTTPSLAIDCLLLHLSLYSICPSSVPLPLSILSFS